MQGSTNIPKRKRPAISARLNILGGAAWTTAGWSTDEAGSTWGEAYILTKMGCSRLQECAHLAWDKATFLRDSRNRLSMKPGTLRCQLVEKMLCSFTRNTVPSLPRSRSFSRFASFFSFLAPLLVSPSPSKRTDSPSDELSEVLSRAFHLNERVSLVKKTWPI